MKTNFKKTLAVIMAMLMLMSVASVTVLAAYTVTFKSGNYGNETDVSLELQTDSNNTVILPDAMFTREHYTQTGWCTGKSNNGTGTKYDFGDSYKTTRNRELYPYWTPAVYQVTYNPGEFSEGTPVVVDVTYNKTTSIRKDIEFVRDGYFISAWTDGETIYDFGKSVKVVGNIDLYPVWSQYDLSHEISETDHNFGKVCIGYSGIEAFTFTFTNKGNVTFELEAPVNANYDIALVSGNAKVAPGQSATFSICPKSGLPVGKYTETIVFNTGYTQVALEIDVSFVVQDHIFNKYVSNGDATYEADGTKTAYCANDCGASDVIVDAGSMKVYSIDNNNAAGLAKEYIHHRTVRFTAYGSGMDDADGVVGKRFRPVSWYVTEEFNGEFTGNQYEDGYDVTFTHTIFGNYTLTINYVEEEYNAETDEWVATDVTDEKTFDYVVGTNEYEEQEIVRPNTILSIIFGLFAKLLELLGLGG